MFIDDYIGDEYKSWRNGSIVLITAQTGKGKTHFVLNTLLQYVIENNGYIFYFVNRKLLKKQIENDILSKEIELSQNDIYILSNYIKVYTYQSIENENKHIEIKNKILEFEKEYKRKRDIMLDDYYFNIFFIYDECHYFYCDSNFNAKTELSYYHLRNIIYNKYGYNKNNGFSYIEIFMSATIEQMKNIIYNHNNNDNDTFCFSRSRNAIKQYDCNLDYSYVNMNILDSKERIPDLIKNSTEKWLIFIDNKNYGKKLMNILENNKIDVIYIDTDYNNDDDSRETVNNITENYLSEKKVIISTSVLDNGVSIKDEQLRNLIILVDNKETFLQMIGRIRINNNDDKVNLYICKKTKQDFEKRLKSLCKLNKFYQKYENSMFNETTHPLNIHEKALYLSEIERLTKRQSKLLNDILSNPLTINYARKICYSVDGLLVISSFSVQRCHQLVTFYKDIIEKFNLQGENAFVYEVGEWLGKTDFEIDYAIIKGQIAYTSTCKNNIDTVLSEKLSNKDSILLSKDENKSIKEKLLKDFIFFLNTKEAKQLTPDKDINKIISDVKKNGRVISSNEFNLIMKIADLPYKLETKRNVGYLLEKV